MILVDTSVWIDHARRPEPVLDEALDQRKVLIHDFVVGELSLGSLGNRAAYEAFLGSLPRIAIASTRFVQALIGEAKLFGTGIGYVDAHLLAAIMLEPSARLWTRDRRLAQVANRLSVLAEQD